MINYVDPHYALYNISYCASFIYDKILLTTPISEAGETFVLAVRHIYSFMFAATLHKWRPSPPSAKLGRVMSWWKGNHLKCW